MIGAYIVGEPPTHPVRIVRCVEPRPCEGCGRPFTPRAPNGKYCTRQCRNRHYYRKDEGYDGATAKRLRTREWHRANPGKLNEYRRRQYARIRAEVLTHYGGFCRCCGETEPAFLGMDHIDGGGNQHRSSFAGPLVRWLYRHGFPPGFQVLCHNCNQAKHIYGQCPHQAKVPS